MRVVNFVGSIYTLQDLISNKEETVRIKRIKPFYYDTHCTDPVDRYSKKRLPIYGC